MKDILKKSWGIILIVILVLLIIFAVTFIKQFFIDKKINDDFTEFLHDEDYINAVSVEGLSVIEQDISSGYAVIEMLSTWLGMDITEESLFTLYDEKIVASSGKSFTEELTLQFPQLNFEMYKNIPNQELLIRIYKSLEDGYPVPFEFAAFYDDGLEKKWTMHYGVVTKMDVPNDAITILNPYGYTETYPIETFLKATRFESYKDMPISLKLGFAFGKFEKNTIFIMEENKFME